MACGERGRRERDVIKLFMPHKIGLLAKQVTSGHGPLGYETLSEIIHS